MIFIQGLIVATLSIAHPMHVAYSNVEINPEKSTISVSHKVYIQDFTLLFFHLFEKEIIPLAESDFSQKEIELIDNYMKERFVLIAGSDTIALNYQRKQQDDEMLWLYFSGSLQNGSPAEIKISNMLLLDLYMDQTNLLIINDGFSEKGLTFNRDKRQETIKLHN